MFAAESGRCRVKRRTRRHGVWLPAFAADDESAGFPPPWPIIEPGAAIAPFQARIPGSMSKPRKLHIKSYGCQMNVYDAQRMVDTLAGEGFLGNVSADAAGLVILHTCHIREKASEKVYSELGRLRVMKDEAARNGRRM